jgi:hypothetical protein
MIYSSLSAEIDTSRNTKGKKEGKQKALFQTGSLTY